MTNSRVELHEWYTLRLRPKLVHAAGAGAISPLRAAELERQMRDLLHEPSGGRAAGTGAPASG